MVTLFTLIHKEEKKETCRRSCKSKEQPQVCGTNRVSGNVEDMWRADCQLAAAFVGQFVLFPPPWVTG